MTQALVVTTEQASAQDVRAGTEAAELVEAYTVDSDQMFELLSADVVQWVTVERRIETRRLEIVRAQDEAKKIATQDHVDALAKLRPAIAAARAKLLRFTVDQRAKADAARREAELAAAQERSRLDREARELRSEAEETGDEAAQVAAEIAEQQAHAVAFAPVFVAERAAPKASGISTRTTWRAEVNDFRALVIAAGAAAEKGDNSLLRLVLPNDKQISKEARAMGGNLNLPGVRVYSDQSLAVRSK